MKGKIKRNQLGNKKIFDNVLSQTDTIIWINQTADSLYYLQIENERLERKLIIEEKNNKELSSENSKAPLTNLCKNFLKKNE